MPTDYSVVLTTFGNQENRKKVISLILEEKLAACIQVIPIESFYMWKDKLTEDKEELAIIKTQSKHFERLQNLILQHHSYEIPEIILLPVSEGFSGYLDWIKHNT